MTKLAYFDSTKASPSPVLGWFDTDFGPYASMPVAANLLTVTEAQWAARLSDPSAWAIASGALVSYVTQAAAPNYALLAKVALDASDTVILRCYEHSVVVPAAWVSYRSDLRSIVAGASVTSLPSRPAYPAGT
jgi:hypothetical protein